MHDSPIRLMQFESAVKHDPAVDRWFETQSLNLGGMARQWFDVMRDLGDDAEVTAALFCRIVNASGFELPFEWGED